MHIYIKYLHICRLDGRRSGKQKEENRLLNHRQKRSTRLEAIALVLEIILQMQTIRIVTNVITHIFSKGLPQDPTR